MSRRFVFVPIFGDTQDGAFRLADKWSKVPHIKAWGFCTEDGEFTPIHTEPECRSIALNESVDLFEVEQKAAIDIPENSTDLPDAVCVALAKLALMPVSRANSND